MEFDREKYLVPGFVQQQQDIGRYNNNMISNKPINERLKSNPSQPKPKEDLFNIPNEDDDLAYHIDDPADLIDNKNYEDENNQAWNRPFDVDEFLRKLRRGKTPE